MEETIDRKAFKPRLHPNGTALYTIYVEGGGRVPNELLGAYSSIAKADLAISQYFQRLAHIERNKRPYHRSRNSGKKDKVGDKQLHKGADNGSEPINIPG